MNKTFLKIIAVCALLCCPAAVLAQSNKSKQQQIIDAVMQVYADELAKNPNDFAVLYSRANQYYVNGDFRHALEDVNAALRVTTRNDLDLLVDEYVLRAKIYRATGKNAMALQDLQEANKLNPSSEPVLYMLAEAYYVNNNYTDARRCYLSLYRRSNIDYVALLGLARTEVKLNNPGQAEEYANTAVRLYPAEPQVYIGRAEVWEMMGRNRDAANDLIMAVSVSNNLREPLQRLVKLSDNAYADVIAALNSAIQSAPGNGMFYYIKSSVQNGHFHYADALKTLNEIISRNLYDYHGIHYDAALAAYNLCRYDEALRHINNATSQSSVTYYFVLKSQICSELGDKQGAYAAIREGRMIDVEDVELTMQKALLDIDAGEYQTALAELNEVVMVVPNWARARFMRGWLQKHCLGNEKAAKSDFEEILLTGDGEERIRGFVLQQLGRNTEAARWCELLIKAHTRAGGEAYFISASVMAQCGDHDKAIDYLGKALMLGYGSYRDITADLSPLRTLQPIWHLDNFKQTVEQRKQLFE